MSDSRLRKDEERGAGSDQSLSQQRKRTIFGRFLNEATAAALAGMIAFGSGTNINDFGGSIAMAQPTPRPRQRQAEPEEVGNLQRLATEAATAYRDYILTGNPARRTEFWNIYNRAYRGQTLHDNVTFMDKLGQELSAIRDNAQVAPLLDAYTRDRDRVWGVRMEPVVMTDFIDFVFNIRSRLGTAPSDQEVQQLVQQYRDSEGRAVRADSNVGRVRSLVQGGMSPEDAARNELMRPGREEAAARYGELLTAELASRMPVELARMSVIALREFILTGDNNRRDEFRRIFDANDATPEFHDAFQRYFRERISRTTDGSGLNAIAQAYGVHHGSQAQPQLDPSEFARMITDLYRAATSGNVDEVNRIRQREGADVVDPLLGRVFTQNGQTVRTEGGIVARGMAQRAVNYVRTVLETGDMSARDAFVAVMNSSLCVVIDGRVQSVTVDNDDIFWNEFRRLYDQEVTGNRRLTTVVRSFARNILPIAIRDIYGELGRANPDITRLNTDYGSRLVSLISSNMANLSWLMRSDASLDAEIVRRAGYEDALAAQMRNTRVSGGSRGHALGEIYVALVAERQQLRSIEGRDLLEQNFDQLSWLNGTPAAVQREIDRRAGARPPDTMAVAMRSRFGTNAGTVLSQSYTQLAALRQARARLVQSYGADFVGLVSRNLDNLQWVIKPVEELDGVIRARPDDAVVREITVSRPQGEVPTYRYTFGTLAPALRDVYAELGRSNADRARLEQRYGAELVQSVAANRANLAWLSGDDASIERALQDQTDPATRAVKAFLYGYNPIQFITAVARARTAISRGGLVLSDARDSLGTVFVAPVAARQAVTTPSQAPEAVEGRRAALEAVSRTIESDLQAMENQLRRSILAPARPMLSEQIRRWRQRSLQIVLDARGTQDPQMMERLAQDQQRLVNTMLTEQDLRKSVELAFSMIHLAETGGDINTQPQLPGVPTAVQQTGGLFTLLQWYRSMRDTNPDKAEAIGNIVSSVLRRADPQLFDFIVGMDEPGYFAGFQRVYRMTRGGAVDSRANLVSRYGDQFVALVESLAPNMQVLDSATASARNLQRGENELFASIVARVYRAVNNPTGNENREAMVRLFGEPFVAAVEAQGAQLSPLGAATAGIDQYRALPQPVRQALLAAYPAAYARSVGAVLRAYRRQDDSLFFAIGSVYDVLSREPPRGASAADRTLFNRRIGELTTLYGEPFIQAVRANFNDLGFITSPNSTVQTMRNLPPNTLDAIQVAFEAGPGPSKGTFMQNFSAMGDALPNVYLNLRNSMIFSTPTDQISTNMGQALTLYRQYFGSNDYLFRQYFNIDLLNQSIPRLARRYNLTLPPQYAEGFRSPEDVVAFMNSQAGRDLITRGRQFYDQIEQNFLLQRQATNYHPTTGEDSDSEVQNLRNRISLFDALYLGVALERVSGTDSSFNQAAGSAIMRSLLFIENRDPYLVGPFLLQVLPAILEVAQDERTLVTSLEAFNQILIQRYQAGLRDLAYSTALNRRYFLEVFARIGQRLPEVTSTYDHNRLEDELRLTPEPRTDEGYLSPFLYRYRPGWWQRGIEPLPTMFGQIGQPLSLLPRPVMSPPGLYVPGVPTLLSDADGLYSRLSDQLVPPAARMFRQRVPPRFRIGALGASTIVRRINELFGPMPVDYSDYWLNAFGEAGGFYQHQQQAGTSIDTGGAAAAASGRTLTGGTAGQARWTRQTTTANSGDATGSTGGPATTVSQTADAVDVNAQAARIPYPLAGVIPLSVSGEGETTLRPESEVAAELQRRAQNNDPAARAVTAARSQGTAAALLDVYRELNKAEPNRERLERQYGRAFVEAVERNMSSLNFVEAPDRGVGLHRGRVQFHYENATGRTDTVTPQPGGGQQTATTGDVQTSGRTNGLLETYSRISRESQTDMLVFVSGEHVPELTGPAQPGSTPPELQQGQDRLKTRMYFITREGNIYQLAYGIDTAAALLNYMYAGANTQQYLASARVVGRDSIVSPPLSAAERAQRQAAGRVPLTGDAARGFDGSAVGFTLPRSGGDSYSALAFGQIVRDMTNMDPVHTEQAVGQAVTSLLSSRRARDIYAAFYRGSQTFTLDPADHTHIQSTRWAEGTGELMWRRMRVDPMSDQFELRVVGGYPATAGVSWRHEMRTSRYRTTAYGVSGAYTSIDLLNQFQSVNSQADQIYARMNTALVDLYGWQEDEARNTGWLAAGSYMYARMEDWTVRNPDGSYTTTPTAPGQTNNAQHYASALFMYWAQRHNLLVGAQRVPGFSRIYDRIDQAMRDIQNNPTQQSQILTALSQNLQNDMNSDIWRFALAYGYDGENVRIYTVGSGQYQRLPGTATTTTTGTPATTQSYDTSYANLYGLFLFGRPTRAYADILAHAYTIAPLVIGETGDPRNGGSVTVTRNNYTPYTDLWTGVGVVDWPSISLNRYQREITLNREPDMIGAMRDIYTDMGGMHNRARLGRVYGEEVVLRMESARNQLSWMMRPEAEITAELRTRRAAEDPTVMSLFNFRDTGTAAALIDIYTELRKANPDMDRLERQYSRDMVNLVARNANDFDFVLLPTDRMRAEFERRSSRSGSPEARIAEATLPAPPSQDALTGREVVRMFERNMLDVLVAATNSPTRSGLSPERYDVLIGSHLSSPEGARQRNRTYYVLHTPVAERAEARGSIVVGDEEDMREWVRQGHEIGGGITRVELAREGAGYKFTFSGDRRLTAFSAVRLVGGVTIPLVGDAYGTHDFGHNWTVGLLMRVLQDHRQDLIAGALYGIRQYGNERWDQATVTFSHRLQMLNTATVSDQLFSYVFFNRTTQKVVFARSDVFQNPTELNDVCSQLGVAGCNNMQEFERTTVGLGVTWARANMVTSERLSLHLFFEGGVESGRQYGAAGSSVYAPYSDRFVWRGGVGVDYLRQAPQSILPTRYFLNFQTQGGSWPLVPGEIGRPEYLGPYRDQINTMIPGWSLMLHGGFQW